MQAVLGLGAGEYLPAAARLCLGKHHDAQLTYQARAVAADRSPLTQFIGSDRRHDAAPTSNAGLLSDRRPESARARRINSRFLVPRALFAESPPFG
jgi:hypothetical protein